MLTKEGEQHLVRPFISGEFRVCRHKSLSSELELLDVERNLRIAAILGGLLLMV